MNTEKDSFNELNEFMSESEYDVSIFEDEGEQLDISELGIDINFDNIQGDF